LRYKKLSQLFKLYGILLKLIKKIGENFYKSRAYFIKNYAMFKNLLFEEMYTDNFSAIQPIAENILHLILR
jgi:hypothetical protein